MPLLQSTIPPARFDRRRLYHVWEKLRASYWFVPAVMVGAATILAMLLITIDERWLSGEMGWLYGGGLDGARALLSTVASSVITVAGVVFSINIATLTQASSQFGPRLLRNFMRDTGSQIVLGTLVATFVYCLLVLRSIDETGAASVPHLSVGVAFLLALASIGVLVYFIHHVSFSLQAPIVVANAWIDIEDAILRMFPEDLGCGGPHPVDADREQTFPESFDREAVPVTAEKSGYIQMVDTEQLMQVAHEFDLRIRLLVRPGDFAVRGHPLMCVWRPQRDEPALSQLLNAQFIVGRYRTPEQDVEFGIAQLVEIAVRALSPGINDPYTAVTCLDWIGDALCRVASSDLHSPFRYDADGVLRIIAKVSTFAGVVDAAFNQIRQYGRESAPVLIRLLEVIATIAPHLRNEEQRETLRRQARIVDEAAETFLPAADDRRDVHERFVTAMRELQCDSEPMDISSDDVRSSSAS